MPITDCDPILCALNSIEESGLNIHQIGILTRQWDEELGKGEPVDTVAYFSPTPRLKEVRQSHSVNEGGTQRKGDLVIRMIPKSQYATRNLIDCSEGNSSKELYYFIDGDLYEVVEVTEKIWQWDIVVKKARKRTLYISEE